MSLLLADFDRAALRVEGDERIAEQPFDVAAARHIRGRKVAQHGWVDQGDRVAERKGDVQFVRSEEHTSELHHPLSSRMPSSA